MANQVVKALFENEKDFPADVGAQPDILSHVRRPKLKTDIARGEALAGKESHSLHQIPQVVFLGIDRPDDIAHRIHQLARSAGNLLKWLAHSGLAMTNAPVNEFAENRDLSK